jgi:hypothetical protein
MFVEKTTGACIVVSYFVCDEILIIEMRKLKPKMK